eukprot:TRINITY_DN3760_c0_g1_i1.p1 TRINITY_DN3760_c0_g1~~TRINITY_DN3760_c0_g1_i1.p1  ORF type:complete len:151 (-),score=16.40 TRINITY_DN3760_c0_g1_i1:26-478(-)
MARGTGRGSIPEVLRPYLFGGIIIGFLAIAMIVIGAIFLANLSTKKTPCADLCSEDCPFNNTCTNVGLFGPFRPCETTFVPGCCDDCGEGWCLCQQFREGGIPLVCCRDNEKRDNSYFIAGIVLIVIGLVFFLLAVVLFALFFRKKGEIS